MKSCTGGFRKQAANWHVDAKFAWRTAISILLLSLTSNAAMARWVAVLNQDNGKTYIDPVTKQRQGDLVRMWDVMVLSNSKSAPNGKAYISDRTQAEYDCKEVRVRTLFRSLHAEDMGGGPSVFSNTATQEWWPVPPESTLEALWTIACAKTPEVPANQSGASMGDFKQESVEKEKIETAHPKWESLVKTASFSRWLKRQPASLQRLVNSQRSEDAILLLDLYKRERQ